MDYKIRTEIIFNGSIVLHESMETETDNLKDVSAIQSETLSELKSRLMKIIPSPLSSSDYIEEERFGLPVVKVMLYYEAVTIEIQSVVFVLGNFNEVIRERFPEVF